MSLGQEMMGWAKDLWPLCRSITGPGTRDTLRYLKDKIPELQIKSVASGTKCFDWTVPEEWFAHGAELWSPEGEKILDFKDSNLHLMGYSAAIDAAVPLAELQQHLHSLPEQPDAIPYVTSYYKRDWGLCLTHNQRMALKPGEYAVKIDTDILPGVMNWGEIVLRGKSEKEILISTNICHPSLANNELSGIVVVAALARELAKRDRRYTYRILFLPETIGAIYYISSNQYDAARPEDVEAGYHCICLGDDRPLGWGERGSDERQWNSALVDLPVVTITRGKIGDYPEYHTSLDNLDFIKPQNLEESYNYILKIIEGHEVNKTYRAIFPCEPQLGKRGLYPQLSTKETIKEVELMLDILRLCNGKRDLSLIANELGSDIFTCSSIAERLVVGGVLESVSV